MISNQEEDEFVAVRVQDPRMQNEGSWNSYVDYKIFLHTNSKAFTAKTSCVRRRYSEFAWLKKKLQKNSGLVPVPELPGKYFFFYSNEDFLERRRKGLQAFLDNVVNMTVCLSDSQLHLFLQTQLPVGHIQDCVQGHTPYSVTDAILTYASSNRGYAQAQEEDAIKQPSLTVSYESMESPAPHQPKDIFSPELLSCDDSDPPEGSAEICDEDSVELRLEENSSVRVVQKNDHLEAIVEDCGPPAEATFFLGDSLDALEGLGLAEPTQQRSCRTRIQTPVEVHSPMGDDLFEEACPVSEEGVTAPDTEEKTGPRPDAEEEEDEDQRESSGEVKTENVDSEPENCADSAAMSDLKDRDFEERGTERDARSQEEVLDAVCSEQQVLETHGASEVGTEDADCPEEFKNPDGQSEGKAETPLQSGIHEETLDVLGVPEEEGSGGDLVLQMDRADLDGGGDGHSSSNESIVRVSDDESICDDAEDSIQDSIQDSIHESQDPIQDSIHESQDSIQSAGGEAKEVCRWSPAEASSRNILDLHTNGRSVEKEDVSEDEDLHNTTGVGDSGKSLEVNLTVTGEDLTENGDLGIMESGCTAAGKCAEQEDESPEEVEAH